MKAETKELIREGSKDFRETLAAFAAFPAFITEKGLMEEYEEWAEQNKDEISQLLG